ncbi:MAG TPA: tripartite tricarboxylate transporter substrate binding protein, partial [Burkholderiaceae bacterium]|nr:tripartite tricarboxylate transporter substrate binding protein [Burkholderiaceae bacterium]
MIRIARVAVAAMLAVGATAAAAQAYPAKPVRVVIPYSPGGGADAAARLVANHLSQALGQSFVIDSKPGGNTLIGTEFVARSAPDGYTLLITGGSTMSLQPLVFPGKLPYDPLNDFAPVGMISTFPFFLVTSSSLPYKSLRELIDAAKKEQLSYASNGTGSIGHVGTEMLSHAAGVQMTHVPYKGFAPALPDVVTGRVSMVMADLAPLNPMLRAGSVRPLAVTSPKRSAFLPDVPTIAESGFPGYQLEVWFALYAPAKTPPEIVQRLSAE